MCGKRLRLRGSADLAGRIECEEGDGEAAAETLREVLARIQSAWQPISMVAALGGMPRPDGDEDKRAHGKQLPGTGACGPAAASSRHMQGCC